MNERYTSKSNALHKDWVLRLFLAALLLLAGFVLVASADTLILNETNGGILADAFFQDLNPYRDTNYGYETSLIIQSYATQNIRFAVLINTSAVASLLPVGATILNITLEVYKYDTGEEGHYNLFYNSSTNWNESNVTWNNQPTYELVDLQDNITINDPAEYKRANITNAFMAAFNQESKPNVSILAMDNDEGSGSGWNNQYYSKENADEHKPRVIIEYIDAGVYEPPVLGIKITSNAINLKADRNGGDCVTSYCLGVDGIGYYWDRHTCKYDLTEGDCNSHSGCYGSDDLVCYSYSEQGACESAGCYWADGSSSSVCTWTVGSPFTFEDIYNAELHTNLTLRTATTACSTSACSLTTQPKGMEDMAVLIYLNITGSATGERYCNLTGTIYNYSTRETTYDVKENITFTGNGIYAFQNNYIGVNPSGFRCNGTSTTIKHLYQNRGGVWGKVLIPFTNPSSFMWIQQAVINVSANTSDNRYTCLGESYAILYAQLTGTLTNAMDFWNNTVGTFGSLVGDVDGAVVNGLYYSGLTSNYYFNSRWGSNVSIYGGSIIGGRLNLNGTVKVYGTVLMNIQLVGGNYDMYNAQLSGSYFNSLYGIVGTFNKISMVGTNYITPFYISKFSSLPTTLSNFYVRVNPASGYHIGFQGLGGNPWNNITFIDSDFGEPIAIQNTPAYKETNSSLAWVKEIYTTTIKVIDSSSKLPLQSNISILSASSDSYYNGSTYFYAINFCNNVSYSTDINGNWTGQLIHMFARSNATAMDINYCDLYFVTATALGHKTAVQPLNITKATEQIIMLELMPEINPPPVEESNMTVNIIGGTEYIPNQVGEVSAILQYKNGTLVINALCSNKIYYPDKSIFADYETMDELENGIYYYNFTVPSSQGVYIAFVNCTKNGNTAYDSHTFHVSNDTITASMLDKEARKEIAKEVWKREDDYREEDLSTWLPFALSLFANVIAIVIVFYLRGSKLRL